MRRVAKWLLLVLLLVQIPFVYSMIQTWRVARYLDSLEPVSPKPSPFVDLRGGIHAHSAEGGHSTGTYPDMFEDAKKAGYKYLFITEHPKDVHLFERIQDSALITIYGYERRDGQFSYLETEDRSVRIVLEPDDRFPASATGAEVFNLHESAAAQDSWYTRALFLYHQVAWEDLFVFRLWEVNRSRLEAWDSALTRRRPITATAGADAHQNLGVIFQTAAGQRIFAILIDPYEDSFRAVSTHVMLGHGETPSAESVLRALKRGAAYIAFEKLGDPTGFSYYGKQGAPTPGMGSTVPRGTTLVARAPRRSEFVVYRDGRVVNRQRTGEVQWRADQPGSYRVEVYPIDPPSLASGKPWIISNPIFVE